MYFFILLTSVLVNGPSGREDTGATFYLLILFADMAFLNSALWSLHDSLVISEVAILAKWHLLFSWGISVIVDVFTGLSGKEFAELAGILDSEVLMS